MNNKQSLSRSITAILRYLFVPEKDPIWVYLVLVAVTLIAAIIRIFDLNRHIFYDEAFTFIQYASRSFKYILASYSAPNNHILHSLLVRVTYLLFGAERWIIRLPAFTAGLAGVLATYLTARRLGSSPQALAASALAAIATGFINYSTNARGYTLIILFSLLLGNFAILLIEKQNMSALVAYGITSVLGFYTIPVFLYPMAGISLWVVVNYLVENDSWKNRMRQLGIFLVVCILSGLFTLMLYSPVLIFGTGLESIIGNEVVSALPWSDFIDGVGTRIEITWGNWMKGLSTLEQYLLLGGFIISLAFYWKVSRQKLPLQLFLILAIVILLLIQRVAPFGRVFLYLEAYYFIFAAAGLIWIFEIFMSRISGRFITEVLLSTTILLLLIGVFIGIWQKTQSAEVKANRDFQAEGYVAMYIAEHITPEDTIVSTAPVDIETAYYLMLYGIPFERFYQRDNPVEIKNALVLLRKNAKFNTPESVLGFYKLTPDMDLDAIEFLYEYAQVQIYSVPAK